MNYSVADAIASMGGDAASGRTGDISAILPYGIAPGAKAVMRKEKKAAEEVGTRRSVVSFEGAMECCTTVSKRSAMSIYFG